MSGTPLPSSDLPDGVVSVRVVRQALSNNLAGVSVTLEGDSRPVTATTDDQGRAVFSGLPTGRTLIASATVDSETLRSRAFQVPGRGGVRLILAAGLSAGGAPGGGAVPSASSANGPLVPAAPGSVVLGAQTRTIVELGDESLDVFHIFELANPAGTPVSVPQPIAIDMPADAQQVSLLEGSTPQARVFEKQLVVAGPFAPGRTMAQVAYRLPVTGPTRALALTLPVPLMQTNVIVRRLGNVRLVEPVLPQSREAQAEGRTYLTGTGPGLPAGGTLRVALDGLPHQPRWPRYAALSVAGAIVLGGLWLMFGARVDAAGRVATLDARRTALLARLQMLEQSGVTSAAAHDERATLLQDLEGMYAMLDAERSRDLDVASGGEPRRL